MTLDKQHIVLYITLAVALISGAYLIADHRAESARTEAAVAKAQLAQVTEANTQFQAQVSAQLAQLQAQNESLEKALASRETTEKSVPTTNGSLNPNQVAQGITTATNAKPNEVSTNGTMIELDLPTGQAALSALQLVPLLQSDKADLTLEVSNDVKALELEKQAHVSDVNTDKKAIESCQADLKSEKAKERRTSSSTSEKEALSVPLWCFIFDK